MSLQQRYAAICKDLPISKRERITDELVFQILSREYDKFNARLKEYSEQDKLKDSPFYQNYKNDFITKAIYVCTLNGDLPGFDKWVLRNNRYLQNQMDKLLFSDEGGTSGSAVFLGELMMGLKKQHGNFRGFIISILKKIG